MRSVTIVCRECRRDYTYKVNYVMNRKRTFCKECALFRKKKCVDLSNSGYRTRVRINQKVVNNKMVWDDSNVMGY